MKTRHIRNTYFTEFTANEIKSFWLNENLNKQGQSQARAATNMCVVVSNIIIDDAIEIVKMWLCLFALPSCTYFDESSGKLSLYCGDAGGGFTTLKAATKALVAGYLVGVENIPITKFVDWWYNNE